MLILEGQNHSSMSIHFEQYQHWLQAEVIVFATGILANVGFLFLRAVFPQSIMLTVASIFNSPQTDYLESQAVLTGLLTTFVVPAGLSFVIHWLCVSEPTLAEDPANAITAEHFVLAVFQSCSIVFLIFVPLFHCPFTTYLDDFWAKCVPFLHALLMGSTFVLIPLYVIIDYFGVMGSIS